MTQRLYPVHWYKCHHLFFPVSETRDFHLWNRKLCLTSPCICVKSITIHIVTFSLSLTSLHPSLFRSDTPTVHLTLLSFYRFCYCQNCLFCCPRFRVSGLFRTVRTRCFTCNIDLKIVLPLRIFYHSSPPIPEVYRVEILKWKEKRKRVNLLMYLIDSGKVV